LLRVSVVVATHNRAGRLAALLASLRAQTLPRDEFEVIVVDDASSDDGATRRALEAEPDIRVIHRERSQGPAAARNAGWRAARAPLVAFTDDDCRTDPGWLAAHVATADAHPGAIVQGRIAPDPDELPDLKPTARTMTVAELGPYYETANMAYPRALLEELGGFDETSFTGPGGEDTDLAWRGIRQGVETVFASDALVYHAVEDIGWLGMLRFCNRWSETMLVYKRYPEIQRGWIYKRYFWKWQHYFLVRWLIAQLLPRRLAPLAFWLALPYNRYLLIDESRRAKWWHAPYVLALDATEMAAVLRGAVRYRVLIV
jgi:glycosyltransferase involved in cell wall biosynthesis